MTMTYPSGRVVTYTRDSLGRISGITTQQNSGTSAVTVLSSASYEPFGAWAGANFGNGVSLTIGYDQDYQITSINAGAGGTLIQNLSYGYDPAGNITSLTDNLASGRSQTFTYDDLNRIWSASGLYGAQSYTYDGVGNRLSETAGGATSAYAYSSTANQISTVTTGTNVRTFGYLASGQVSTDQRTPASSYAYTINNNGRLQSASANGTGVSSYLYNGFEQRVQKTVGSAVTDFIYDRLGHLLAEANDATGAPIREYIWLDNTPVAVVDDSGSSPVVYYIHTDHLGRPQKLTDGSANIAWDGVFDPFGNLTTVNGSTTMLLMFPGQYYDSETQLSQNWHRDYDPTLGRYIESDPTGLAAGINTYVYAVGSPLSNVDASGLCSEYCKNLVRNMRTKAQKLIDELRSYDPILDAQGGSPMRWGGGVTSSGGHFTEISDLQRGLKNDLKRYLKECMCDNGSNNDCPPYPKWIDELANRPVEEPYTPPPASSPSMTPEAKEMTVFGIIGSIIVGVGLALSPAGM